MATTIQIEEDVKHRLDKIKVHPRESYNELIEKMLESYRTDSECMKETIEVLSDPETMRELAEAISEFKSGKGKTIEQLKKELKIES